MEIIKSSKKKQVIKNYQIENKLGEGSFSIVYKAKHLPTNRDFAIKEIDITKFEQKEKQNILNEVRILASIDHPNIIRYVDSFTDPESKKL